ncbi:MAG: hypothetical protein CME62_02160 [Halobacteriovoraceae bacterium]|nr:hypothetical protein [Halobacteriovoraceae bacterium]|tara:strand:+ start:5949 stop:7937 length:1989 start_codon:yes stop_codon:yes gene_type:complete
MSLRKILNQKGSALANIIAVSAAVGVGAVMIGQTGKLRSKMDRDVTQNTIIQNTVLDIKTYLASEKNCYQALNAAPAFSRIGDYAPNMDLTNGVRISEIKDMNPGERERTLIIMFEKVVSANSDGSEIKKNRPDQVAIQTFLKPDPSNPGSSIETCTSFETTGVDNSLLTLCATVGGEYNASTGECVPNYQGTNPIGNAFRNQVDQIACRILGGNLSGTTCDRVNITGPIESSHFKLGDIDLGATDKVASQTLTCSDGQLAMGMERNGQINCRDISCPKPSGENASDYIFRNVGGDYFCQCTRNRGPGYDCGSRFPSDIGDGLGCADETVNDGCGTGETCIIRRKIPICPRRAGCDEVVRNDCGEVCDTGPSSNTWSPAPSTVCDGESFTQSNDCGQSRSAVGTMDCEQPQPPCNPSWSPARSTVCSGESFTQSSQCPAPNNRRSSTGTKDCSDDTPCCFRERDACDSIHGDCTYTGGEYCGRVCSGTTGNTCSSPSGNIGSEFNTAGWPSDAAARWRTYSTEQCCLQRGMNGCTEPGDAYFECTSTGWRFSRCGGGGCRNRTWSPEPSTVCAGETFQQRSNCSAIRDAVGTKDCSNPPRWKVSGPTMCLRDFYLSCGQRLRESCNEGESSRCGYTGSDRSVDTCDYSGGRGYLSRSMYCER